jgi:hypothetical protein
VKGLLRAAAVAGLMLGAMLAPSAVANANATTIDFSTHSQGAFDQGFYQSDGVVFTQGSFVGYIQGDEALVGPIAGSFKPKVSSLSARIAPAVQGTAIYTLSALGPSGHVIESTSVTITQDSGDPATGPLGYATIDLGTLPKKAAAFTLTNTFVRSSYPQYTSIPFGVSSLTF